jgi:hypothetical protein
MRKRDPLQAQLREWMPRWHCIPQRKLRHVSPLPHRILVLRDCFEHRSSAVHGTRVILHRFGGLCALAAQILIECLDALGVITLVTG